MRSQLLYSVTAFVLGLIVGGVAFGQKPTNDAVADGAPADDLSQLSTARDAKQETASSAATVKPSGVAPDANQSPNGIADNDSQDITLDPMSAAEQLQVLSARWVDLENQMRNLTQRFDSLERRVSAQDTDGASNQGSALSVVPARTSDSRRQALVAAGVSEDQAQEIVWRQSEQDLTRLELRDQAIREGWFRSERYFEELQALDEQGVKLREEIGDQAYDNFLFQTGANNRVTVTSIIPGSVAELSGMQPGDIIESYAGDGIYGVGDLRTATTAGTRGEQIPLTIRRGDELIETWVARGPVGVTLESTSIPP